MPYHRMGRFSSEIPTTKNIFSHFYLTPVNYKINVSKFSSGWHKECFPNGRCGSGKYFVAFFWKVLATNVQVRTHYMVWLYFGCWSGWHSTNALTLGKHALPPNLLYLFSITGTLPVWPRIILGLADATLQETLLGLLLSCCFFYLVILPHFRCVTSNCTSISCWLKEFVAARCPNAAARPTCSNDYEYFSVVPLHKLSLWCRTTARIIQQIVRVEVSRPAAFQTSSRSLQRRPFGSTVNFPEENEGLDLQDQVVGGPFTDRRKITFRTFSGPLPDASAENCFPDLFRTFSGPLPDLFRTSSGPLPEPFPDLFRTFSGRFRQDLPWTSFPGNFNGTSSKESSRLFRQGLPDLFQTFSAWLSKSFPDLFWPFPKRLLDFSRHHLDISQTCRFPQDRSQISPEFLLELCVNVCNSSPHEPWLTNLKNESANNDLCQL